MSNKNLIILLLAFTGISFSSELALIVKVKSQSAVEKGPVTIAATGNSAWDALNNAYCCTELKQLSSDLKNNDNAEKLGLNKIYTLRLSCVNEDTALVLNKFLKTDCFEFVEVNEALKSTSVMSNVSYYPNDPLLMWQWSLHNTAQDNTIITKENVDIDMPNAWGIEQGDSSVIIAILDSGIKNWHNEFDGRIWINKNEIPDNGIDDDINGFIDDVNGWNFVDNNNKTDDCEGHGTAVASIIGSNFDNLQGMAGINAKSKLMILKISDSAGNAYTEKTTDAIQYAVNNGAKVINFSFAGPKFSQVTNDFIQFAYKHNVTICAGSGNNNIDTVYYPAKCQYVIAVGATDPMDKRSESWVLNTGVVGGSNYGDSLDVVAPGDSIVILYYKSGNYYRRNGTSYSTAFVTGLVSLLLSQDSTRTPNEIYHLLTTTAEDQVGDSLEDTPGYDKYYGYGRINAYKALLAGQATLLHKKSKPAQLSVQVTNVCFVKNINQLHITLNNNNNQKSTAEFKLLTPQGRVVHSVNEVVSSNELSIALPHLSRGIYCYSIELNGNRHNGKFVF